MVNDGARRHALMENDTVVAPWGASNRGPPMVLGLIGQGLGDLNDVALLDDGKWYVALEKRRRAALAEAVLKIVMTLTSEFRQNGHREL